MMFFPWARRALIVVTSAAALTLAGCGAMIAQNPSSPL